MKIGFLFPGQGAQSVGMGKDLYEKYDEVKKVYSTLSKAAGIDIADLTFNSQEELSQTKNTQIAILAMSLGILKLLEEKNIKADYATGLSLGEYAALTYAKSFTLEDVGKIVKKRGEFMQNLLPEGDWAMAAVIGMEDEKIEEVCKKVVQGFAVPANYNCPGQVAVSGDKAGILEMSEIAKEEGAKRVVSLKTSGPFHTEKLVEASKALRKELNLIEIKTPNCNVIKNIDAKPYTEVDDIRDILAKHVINPVRFSASVKYMLDNGVDTFVEIGPGKVLTSFVKKINREAKCININDVQSFENTISELGKNKKELEII